jgi:RNA polymerase sigma-70 factor (ECF subfamily)
MLETSLSLLDQLRLEPNPESWQRLVELYTPLIRGWLGRYGLADADVDDLSQEVMAAVVRELPHFRHENRPGAFRGWLRVILVNRLRYFWRARQHRPQAVGGSDFLKRLDELEDANSAASQLWEREHDQEVMRRLLDLVQPRFAPQTWQAFRRQVLDGLAPEAVAQELRLALPSVYAAKSRVLKALRTVAEGLVS